MPGLLPDHSSRPALKNPLGGIYSFWRASAQVKTGSPKPRPQGTEQWRGPLAIREEKSILPLEQPCGVDMTQARSLGAYEGERTSVWDTARGRKRTRLGAARLREVTTRPPTVTETRAEPPRARSQLRPTPWSGGSLPAVGAYCVQASWQMLAHGTLPGIPCRRVRKPRPEWLCNVPGATQHRRFQKSRWCLSWAWKDGYGFYKQNAGLEGLQSRGSTQAEGVR